MAASAAVGSADPKREYRHGPTLFPPLMDGLIEGAAAGAKLLFGDNLYMYGPVDGPLSLWFPGLQPEKQANAL